MNRPVIWQSIFYITLVLFGMIAASSYFPPSERQWFFLSAILFSLASLLSSRRTNIIPLILICLILIALLAFPQSISVYTQRIQSIAVGLALSIICQFIFIFRFPQKEFQYEWNAFMKAIIQFNTDFFTCLLEPEYGIHIYKYERRIHFTKNKIWSSLSKINTLCERFLSKKDEEKLGLVSHSDKLISILFSLGQLRSRISDHTVFSVCHIDLQNLRDAINHCFLAKSKNWQSSGVELDRFNQAIKHFESTYQNVLQVTSSEPLGILLFIFDLNRLHDELRMNEYSI